MVSEQRNTWFHAHIIFSSFCFGLIFIDWSRFHLPRLDLSLKLIKSSSSSPSLFGRVLISLNRALILQLSTWLSDLSSILLISRLDFLDCFDLLMWSDSSDRLQSPSLILVEYQFVNRTWIIHFTILIYRWFELRLLVSYAILCLFLSVLRTESMSMVKLDSNFKSCTATSDLLKISSQKVLDVPFGSSSPRIASDWPGRVILEVQHRIHR